MTTATTDVLVAVRDPGTANAIRGMLAALPGFVPRHAAGLAEALRALGQQAFDVVLLDLPPGEDLQVLDRVLAAAPHAAIVVLGAVDDDDLAARALHAGAQDHVLLSQLTSPRLARVLTIAAERKRVETALRASESRYRGLFENAVEGMFVSLAEGRPLVVNQALARLLGYESPAQMLAAATDLSRRVFANRADRAELNRIVAERGEARGFETELVRRDGRRVWARIHASALRDPAGRLIGLEGSVEDITDRRVAEGALHAAQERLAHVVASSPAVLYALTPEGAGYTATWVSGNVERVLGYSMDEALAPDWWAKGIHPDDLALALALSNDRAPQRREAFTYRFRHRGGGYLWVLDEQRAFFDERGALVEIVGSWLDVTPQHEAELALEESERQYRLLFDSSPHPMWVYDHETLAFLAVNEAAIRLYGWSRSEFLAGTIADIRPPEDVPEFLEHTAERRARGDLPSPRMAVRHRTKDGTVLAVEIAVRRITFQGRPAHLTLAVDVTERKSLEAQLAQAQKMEAIGQLAGGVAHDFNNLLGVITGYIDLLERDLPRGSRAAHRADEIRAAANRAAGLTRQLLAFSRRQVLQATLLDLEEVVRGLEDMLRRLIGEQVQIVCVYGPGLGRVRADRGQIEQVLMNLAVNARDAMPSGGTLAIEAANATLDETYARSHPDAVPGPHVCLSVSDTGHGMDAETRARIFEPFFTTKPEGKGTGLGLSVVYGIVRQSGGTVNAYSEPGRGTTFRVYLPRVDDGAQIEHSAQPGQPSGGSETILLVEDSEALREVIAEVLGDAGYTVLPAASPERALDIARTRESPIDAVLTDVVMPGLTGPALVDELRRLMPGLHVLFMSGYTDEAITQQRVLGPEASFIQKPFTNDALLARLRSILGGT